MTACHLHWYGGAYGGAASRTIGGACRAAVRQALSRFAVVLWTPSELPSIPDKRAPLRGTFPSPGPHRHSRPQHHTLPAASSAHEYSCPAQTDSKEWLPSTSTGTLELKEPRVKLPAPLPSWPNDPSPAPHQTTQSTSHDGELGMCELLQPVVQCRLPSSPRGLLDATETPHTPHPNTASRSALPPGRHLATPGGSAASLRMHGRRPAGHGSRGLHAASSDDSGIQRISCSRVQLACKQVLAPHRFRKTLALQMFY